MIDTIICGEASKVLQQIPDNLIDLTVTSPPYDNIRTYKGFVFSFENIARELFRVTKQGGVVVWIVSDQTINGSETGTSFEQALYFKKMGFNLHDTMIYHKNGLQFPETTRYYPVFEYMFVFSKGKPKTIHLIADRANKQAGNKTSGSQREQDGSISQKIGKRLGRSIKPYGVRWNIWKYNTGYNHQSKDIRVHKHPGSFPEQLAEDHILSWSNAGDIVLDPMCGSGTTLKMAKKNNRHYIGIDISEEYCKLSEERIL